MSKSIVKKRVRQIERQTVEAICRQFISSFTAEFLKERKSLEVEKLKERISNLEQESRLARYAMAAMAPLRERISMAISLGAQRDANLHQLYTDFESASGMVERFLHATDHYDIVNLIKAEEKKKDGQ